MSHHHHHHRFDDTPRDPNYKEKAAISIFWQVFRRFAKKYRFKLTVGILAGLIMGGSVSVLLRVMDFGLNVFENLNETPKQAIVQTVDQQPATQTEQPAEETAPQVETLSQEPEKAPQEIQTEEQPKTKGIEKYLVQAEKVAEYLGFELKIDRDAPLSLPLLLSIMLIVLILFILRALGEFINRYCLNWVGSRMVTDIRIELFRSLQEQSATYFDHVDVGQLIARCVNDTGTIEHSITSSVAELCTGPVMIIAAFQFILSKAMDMKLFTQSLWLLLAVPSCIVPVYILSRYIRKYQKRVLSGIAVLVGKMQENFSGIHVIKAFNAEERENKRFTKISDDYFREIRRAMLADLAVQPILQFTVLLVGGVFLLVCYKYGISLASLATLGFAAQEAYRPIKELAKLNNSFQRSAAACERILEVLNSNTQLKVQEPVARPDTFHDQITFDDVNFAYGPQDGNVISDFNLTIKKGQLVAIVGATGSGKSTIAKLLARFYDVTSGSISIDGNDIRHIDNSNLRNLVGIVSQETFLFNESIAENIRFGKPDATLAELQNAAEQANADEFILAAKDQFDHVVGERGALLSGGQRQRLAIARAILRNPPILILDEATSALDTKTEKKVQEAFDKLMKDRTVLAIAHRFSTILGADLILVCDHGRIVEQGTHAELYELNGAYRKLYDLQFSSNNNQE